MTSDAPRTAAELGLMQGNPPPPDKRVTVDVGLVIPLGFDAAVRAGESPVLTVVLPSSPSFDSEYVNAVLERSLQSLAGQAPPARIVQRSLPPEAGGTTAIEALGVRKDFILVSIIMLLAMIAVYAVPAVLVEETEKKTMEALTLIASTADVIAAKALFGIALCVVGVPVLLIITRGDPASSASLAAAVLLSAVVLVGIGLLCAGVFKTQQQVNTWSGVVSAGPAGPRVHDRHADSGGRQGGAGVPAYGPDLPPDRQRLRRARPLSP